jgi:hypothetical protein
VEPAARGARAGTGVRTRKRAVAVLPPVPTLTSTEGSPDARDLPRGTVTFLFTDIEGSTRLLDALGAEAYADALEEHRRALRAAFELDRDNYEPSIDRATPQFELGREQGRLLTLAQAVDEALATRSSSIGT